ncbi:MAG: hypothetical protein JWO52_4146 [Gammaproteobacteria bacterium]|jgi:hypothetical protein|nr:hypothetical protein [Gammaproteobacteria bacterium]
MAYSKRAINKQGAAVNARARSTVEASMLTGSAFEGLSLRSIIRKPDVTVCANAAVFALISHNSPAPRYRNRLSTVLGVQLSEYGSDM